MSNYDIPPPKEVKRSKEKLHKNLEL